jgi:peptide-methionine (S)-S-oxide reductase
MSLHSAATERPPQPALDLPVSNDAATRTVVFAGGCFWCTEAAFEPLRGVKKVVSGYAGDTREKATYKIVCSGMTNHAEAIRIEYDPAQISYGRLLQVFFFAHDPTTKDRQGADRGRQYRSAIFVANEEEKKVAAAYIAQLDAAKFFPGPIVTTLEPLTEFYPAEDYHQEYVKNNPTQPYVMACSLPKVRMVREAFKDWLK